MRTKIDIFSGFLGAGKTMLIKKILKEGFIQESIVIIENEFGEVGIDGSILRKSNIEVKEINAGCICCTVAGDFSKAIIEVLDKYHPSRILIEPSGVGKLSEVISVCKSEELKERVLINMVITVVDVLKLEMYSANFSEFYKNQISNAKTIILSRTQKASTEKITAVIEKIREINARANIITTPWDKLKGDRILEIAESGFKTDSLEEINLLKKPASSAFLKKNTSHSAKDVFQTWGIETPKSYSKERINNILARIKNDKLYGSVLRAKGIIQVNEREWIQFDYVPGELEMRSTVPDYTGRVCVIGSNLHKENLINLFS